MAELRPSTQHRRDEATPSASSQVSNYLCQSMLTCIILMAHHHDRPILTGDDAKKIEGDLYGPTMIVFTLAAILVMSMKAQENTQNLVGAEGTYS